VAANRSRGARAAGPNSPFPTNQPGVIVAAVSDLPPGAQPFARYAYAPNHLGYCGPADSAALFELAATGRTEADITSVASRFTGAWPYLCALAELTGIDDPLDIRLVRAYWTGSSLLDGVDQARFGRPHRRRSHDRARRSRAR